MDETLAAQRTVPEDVVAGYFDSMSNWGRWGVDDQRGALNLITPERAAAACRSVVAGEHIGCGRLIEWAPRPDPVEAAIPPIHFMQRSGEGARGHGMDNAYDWAGLPLHGLYVTHLDAPSHVFWNGTMYNGVAAGRVTASTGARSGSVELAADGIVGRGVLLDVPAALGIDWLADGVAITPADLLAAERHGDVRIGAGDIVFIRTGYGARRPGTSADLPGLGAECLPLLREREPAVIATDAGTDVYPSRYESMEAPVHAVCLVAMGVWIIDNCDLEGLACAARRYERHEFLASIQPLRLKNSTGCPVNPVAIF